MKIWYLLPEMKLGGAEQHVLRLASGLRERGYDAGIATVFREGVLASAVREEKIPFVCLKAKKGWGVRTFLEIARWIRSERADLLHTYLFGFHFFAGLPARMFDVPVIVSSRREISHWQKKRHRLLENLGNFFTDRVVCCSKAVRRWVLEKENLHPEKVLTIHNGIDLEHFKRRANNRGIRREFGIPENSQVVGTIANFASEKDYPNLLAAANQCLRERQNLWFLCVGSGPLESEIKERAKKITGYERMIFTGSRRDIPDLLEAMDVFALASVIEGFPNVILEAMAMARPVVASRVGGIPELIESGVNGILVPPRNATALAEAILSLLEDQGKRVFLGTNAEEKITREFSLDRMLDQYEALYHSQDKLCAASSESYILK